MSNVQPFKLDYCERKDAVQVNDELASTNRIKHNTNDFLTVNENTLLNFDRVAGDMHLGALHHDGVNVPKENIPGSLSHDLFLDGQSLQKIKSVEDKQVALVQIAEQFEAIFLQQMLKSMRAASIVFADEDNPLSSQSDSMYNDMMDSQLALNMSQSKGIGIAEMLIQQLSKR